ncbi:MAG: class I SAM-dependent methyltransferase [bacterium]|nr:class I SAM-dependent methyltransferase [bacterium]
MTDLPIALRNTLSEHGIQVNSCLEKIEHLVNIVTFYRRKLNLYANNSVDNLWKKLALESLYALPFLRKQGTLLDVGSGNGIPGLVYALLQPNIMVILTETVRKKAITLERIRLQVGVHNATVFIGRVEQHPPIHVDYISARAVAPLPEIWKWTRPFCKPDTLFLLFRGSNERTVNLPPKELTQIHCQTVNEQGLALWVAQVNFSPNEDQTK